MKTQAPDCVIRQIAGIVHTGRNRTSKEAFVMSEQIGGIGFLVGFFVLWFVLNKWVFPKFGIRT